MLNKRLMAFFVGFAILTLILTVIIRTKTDSNLAFAKVEVADIDVSIYGGQSRGDPKLFYEYFQDSNLEKYWPSFDKVTSLTFQKDRSVFMDVIIKNDGFTVYNEPTFSIDSPMPFYILIDIYDRHGYPKFDKGNFTDPYTCAIRSYQGCLISVKLKEKLAPFSTVKFSIAHGDKLNSTTPKQNYPFEYAELYGHGNETYFFRPWPVNNSDKINIYMDNTLIHTINVTFGE